ncbi:MAG: hypothetical protein JXB62_20700 [Pirellulales bacterium]|nr:hypothetical protein [Pirellulales bacterium]
MSETSTLEIAGRESVVQPGVYRYDGALRPNPQATSLAVNSAESQQRLRRGLAPLARRFEAERDKHIRRGWRNLATEAVEVRASGTRDDRFNAKNVIDGKTWEMPVDGLVDYALGNIETTGNGGYGRGATPYNDNLSSWQLFFRPTYWLLPPGITGNVTIKLRQPSRVKLVRLLNTSNAGLNDFATVRCKLELLDKDERPLWSKPVVFGRPWDRAFQAAFARPKFFHSYGESFHEILEPGATVPFGTGWQDIDVDCPQDVQYVRVKIDKYWAMGGGLNEVQVYPQ